MSLSNRKIAIGRREFASRRRNLMAAMEENSIAIIPSAELVTRSHDTEFKFRQDSDFHYLTGFNEPESVLVIAPGRKHGESVLFCRERDPERELWDGLRVGPERATDEIGVDDAFPINDIDEILPGLLEGKHRVYYAMGKRPEFDARLMSWINVLRANARSGEHPPGEFLDLDHLLHDMRLYKSRAEQRVMAAAARISANAHTLAMQVCEPGMTEYQLEAVYLNHFAVEGAQAAAYSTIVGSGGNACILHYVENNQAIKKGDLVLVDAGCELNGYAADITRTFPADGKFSKEQAAIYDIVLAAQEAAIDVVKPGNHWNDPHDQTVRVITQGLKDLGLLKGSVDGLIEKEAYKPFYMHRAGHWLGLDVHDVGDYRVGDAWRVLEPGMALTVEPGIYIAPGNKSVPARWRGIGVRIEDDVIVNTNGCDVITSGVVKRRHDIELLMAGSGESSKSSAQTKNAGKAKVEKKAVKKVAKKATKKAASAKKSSSGKTRLKKSAAKKSVKAKPAAKRKPKKKKATR